MTAIDLGETKLVPYVQLNAVEWALMGALDGEALRIALQAIRREQFEREVILVLPGDGPRSGVISEECELTIQEVVLPICESLRGVLRRLEVLSRYVGEQAVTPPAPTDESLGIRLRQALQTTREVLRLEGVPHDDERFAALRSLMELTEAVPVALEAKELLRELCGELKSALCNLHRLATDEGWEEVVEEDRKEIVERVLRCLAGSSGGGVHIPPKWAGGLEWLPPQLKEDLERRVIADQ